MHSGYMSREDAERELAEHPPPEFPHAGAYIGAILCPLLGVIFAIFAFNRGKTGPGMALLVTSWLAGLGWLAIAVASA